MASTIMFQGTASHVGKTTLVAGMCRLLSRMGYRVAPFKAQNMSLNSYVTPEGHEIARAQALQAFAAGVEPTVDMNPILLKPKGMGVSQVVLRGKPYMDLEAGSYYADFALKVGLEVVGESLRSLMDAFDVVVIEGAGSAVEPNLYDRDIANMRVARLVGSPVLLVADIDLGGAFASILGTLDILREQDRDMVRGYVINKFRGERRLLEPAIEYLESRTSRRVLGVIPHLGQLMLPSEDSVSIGNMNPRGAVDVAVLRLPSISNFTDVEALALNSAVRLRYVGGPHEFGSPKLLVIPGSKNTVSDLEWLKSTGLADTVKRYALRGSGWTLGICGGYEMLGKRIVDPLGVEGTEPGDHDALGLLDVTTFFEDYTKTTRRVDFQVTGDPLPQILGGLVGHTFRGYEIRMGRIRVGSAAKRFLLLRPTGSHDAAWEVGGVWDPATRVLGTSVHGFFDDPMVTTSVLEALGGQVGRTHVASPQELWDAELDRIARALKENMDLDAVLQLMGLRGSHRTTK